MGAYRFVHSADVHLDSPLRSLALRDPRLAEFVGNASRQVFSRIVDLCLDEQVNALLLAGDLYDGEQTSMKTARFLAEQLRRLDAAGIQVFIIRGNHDALSKITKELVLPENVHLFGGRADAVEIPRDRGERPIAIHGLSFAKPQAPESLLAKYRPPVTGAINIGLMHTSLDGSPPHDVYSELVTQPSNGSELLIAKGSDGGSKIASELSKGTRFQLYLALRVAGYHEFAKAQVPPPFFADDIMETFDDFRAEEAFRLLAGMVATGQVVYFTHHRHLREIATAVEPTAIVHDLESGTRVRATSRAA
jgi:DNA repair exonuclease SbcCD nuclease subunit